MKTIEEGVNNYSILKNGEPRDNQFFEMTERGLDYQVTEAFLAGVEFAQRWIPVEEELPEYNLDILFKKMNNNARIHLGHRSQLVNDFVEMAITFKNITHWRPIEMI